MLRPTLWCRPILAAIALAFLLSSCNQQEDHLQEGSWSHALQSLQEPVGSADQRYLVYVPVYSSIYWGMNEQVPDLAVTLSIRNLSPQYPIAVHSVRYNDSNGKMVREYLERPGSLGPLATADFVIQRRDRSGGTAASFLVEWSSRHDVDDPVIEAVMVGQHGNASISFTSQGRSLLQESPRQPAAE
jgi:hypothetical protein